MKTCHGNVTISNLRCVRKVRIYRILVIHIYIYNYNNELATFVVADHKF